MISRYIVQVFVKGFDSNLINDEKAPFWVDQQIAPNDTGSSFTGLSMLLMILFDWVINNADLRNCGMAVLVKTSIQKHHKAMCRYSTQCFGTLLNVLVGPMPIEWVGPLPI